MLIYDIRPSITVEGSVRIGLVDFTGRIPNYNHDAEIQKMIESLRIIDLKNIFKQTKRTNDTNPKNKKITKTLKKLQKSL